ncbi:MAG: DUF1679 domain-containing protein [Polyangiaceae bacterium]|nr:DUF1679 domain-containing protein [Polyangiaceae bacterium]
MTSPPPVLNREVRDAVGAVSARAVARVQTLWSGYGAIWRYALVGAAAPTVIVKQVTPPNEAKHPRGWHSDLSHKRKLHSYRVEHAWYAHFARTARDSRVPDALYTRGQNGSWTFVLEDLDAAGFPERRSRLTPSEMDACLRWLANFHACFFGCPGEGLWPTGSYWHLETRPDEHRAMRDTALQRAATDIDERLGRAQFQCLIHGDAKIANFCFPQQRNSSALSVAAVDFQYVGKGCGMKDVAYWLSSCLGEDQLQTQAPQLLTLYFQHLSQALEKHRPAVDAAAVEGEWRSLYPLAWADFVRFLDGWAPEHNKLHGYSRRITSEALRYLDSGPSPSDHRRQH